MHYRLPKPSAWNPREWCAWASCITTPPPRWIACSLPSANGSEKEFDRRHRPYSLVATASRQRSELFFPNNRNIHRRLAIVSSRISCLLRPQERSLLGKPPQPCPAVCRPQERPMSGHSFFETPIGDWRKRLGITVEVMRELSLHTNPQAMQHVYARRMLELFPVSRYLQLSRRGLERPDVR